jgi:hypothetical protein
MLTTLVDLSPAWVNIRVEQPKRYVDGIEILDERILAQHGCFVRVKRWLRGAHPHLGVINPKGWTGVETVVEQDVIRPVATFYVGEAPEAVIVKFPEFAGESVAVAFQALLPS